MNKKRSTHLSYCSLSDAQQERRHRKLQQELCSGIQEVVQLQDGYALRFPGEGGWFRRLATVVELERRCCPSFSFELRAERHTGPIWFQLRAPEGTAGVLAGVLRRCGVHV